MSTVRINEPLNREYVHLYRCSLCAQLFAVDSANVMRAAGNYHDGCPRKLIAMMTGPGGLFSLANVARENPGWPVLEPVFIYGRETTGETVDVYTKVGE